MDDCVERSEPGQRYRQRRPVRKVDRYMGKLLALEGWRSAAEAGDVPPVLQQLLGDGLADTGAYAGDERATRALVGCRGRLAHHE